MNYFISESDLCIKDQNPFVAKELAYLIPTVNNKTYVNLIESNNWHRAYYQNKSVEAFSDCLVPNEPWYKKMVEFLFSGKFGNWIDNGLLRITLKHWQKKHHKISKEDFDLQFRSRKHVCKYHTHGNQNKILQLWETKIRDFEIQYGLNLTAAKTESHEDIKK